ncbi:LuxR C-terminal-related transcriptional regulator [Flavobacterium psychraquaticum]|uniref:LuxR C-terminal-related transcriptional regulator n=1 Tax=Flavobacterium psychraquaticum TaxID=3103958 RepID=UPI003BEF233F
MINTLITNQLILLINYQKRELEIAKLLVKGEGNLEISNFLDIQMSTVSTYKNRVFEK